MITKKVNAFFLNCYYRHTDRYDGKFGGRERDRDRERRYDKKYDDNYDSSDYGNRDLTREWEKTRDREMELREKERMAEFRDYREEPRREKHGIRRREESKYRPVETVEGTRDNRPSVVENNERDRVLVDLKREPSVETSSNQFKSPEREKHDRDKHTDREKHNEREKKSKEKKKKKKDEDKKKKKKKMKDKLEKKSEGTPVDTGEGVKEELGDGNVEVVEPAVHAMDELYGDLDVNVDQSVVENYNKVLESQPNEGDAKDVVLAPLPEISKWEKEDELPSQSDESKAIGTEEDKQITSEVLKRAENVLFKKSSNLPPIQAEKKVERKIETRVKEKERVEKEVEKPKEKIVEKEKEVEKIREKYTEKDDRERYRDREREKERDRDRYKTNSSGASREHARELSDRPSKDGPRSVAMSIKNDAYDRSRSSDKYKGQTLKRSPVRISAKDRLGDKIEDKLVVKREIRGDRREIKIEKISKSVSRKEQSRGKDRREEGLSKRHDSVRSNSCDKKSGAGEEFVPDYEHLEAEEGELISTGKRSASTEVSSSQKKIKIQEVSKEDISSDDSDDSSDDESEKRRRKKKKKKRKSKKKKRRHSSSDSDSSSSSSDSEVEKKKKKHKHKSHKKAKKKKKSKK